MRTESEIKPFGDGDPAQRRRLARHWLFAFLGSIASMAVGGWLEASAAPIPIETPVRSEPVDFEREVLPILRANCTACHNERKAESGLALETPERILKGGEQGPAALPGKGAESLLIKAAAHQAESIMPPAENAVGARPLTSAELGLLKLWIDQGAKGSIAALRPVRWQPPSPGYAPILSVAVTTDGQYAACARGNRLFVYPLAFGNEPILLADPTLAVEASGLAADRAHADLIRSLAFNRQGTLLASGGFREIKLWRVPRVERLAEWKHAAPVTTVAASPKGTMAAVGFENGAVHVCELATGRVLHEIAAHQGAVAGLVFSPEGDFLYSSAQDKTLRSWKTADGAAQGIAGETPAMPRALALLPGGQILLTGEEDGAVRTWSAKALRESAESLPASLLEIKAHGGPVLALATPTNVAGEFYSAGEDGRVRRWNVESGKQLAEFKGEGPISALAVRPDGSRIAAAGEREFSLWNAETGKPVPLPLGDPRLLAKVAEIDAQIAFSKSAIALAKQDIKLYEGVERRVMTTAEEVKKAEAELGKVEKTRDEKQQALEKARSENKDAKSVESAEKALAEAETAVQVAGTVVERAKVVAERAVQDLAAAQTAVAEREEVQKRQEAAKIEAEAAGKSPLAVRALSFSADGARLAAAGADGTLHFYQADGGIHAQSVEAHGGAVVGLSMTNENLLLSASADGRFAVWNAGSEWKLLRTLSAAGPESGGRPIERAGPVDRVLALDFSPDGTLLVSGGGVPSISGELKLWSPLDGRLVQEIKDAHADAIFSARFSPDGKRLATAAADRLVKVFQIESGECVRAFAGHTAHVLGVAWKGDGTQLVSCGSDNVLKLWQMDTGLPVRTMKGTTYQIGPYRGEVTGVAFVGESEQILAASGDGTVRLHRTSSEADILTFSGAKGYQYAVAATPDGRLLLSGGSDGVLRLWSGTANQIKRSIP